MDDVLKLGADIGHVGVVDVHSVVVGNIQHDQGDVPHPGDVLIPLGHAVADVVAAQHEIGLRHPHLTVGLDGLAAQILLPAVGKSFDLIDVIQHRVGLHGLGVLLGLAGLGVDDDLAVLVLQGLAAVGVDYVLAGFQIHLPGSALAGGVGQGDPGVAADVVVKAQVLGSLAHDLAVPVGGDAGGLVLGVHDIQIKGLSQFAGELGAGPAHQFALGVSLTGVRVNILDDLAQCLYAGAYFFSHKIYPP